MNLTEMQDKRGRLVTEARAALDEIKSNTNEARSAELDERHDTIMAEFDKTDKLIAREQKIADIEARAAEAEERARKAQRPNGDGESRGADDGDKITYRQAFHELMKAGGDKSEMPEEARSVLQAGFNPISPELRAQTTTNAAGGYTVPTELMNRIVERMLFSGPMYDPGVTEVIVSDKGNTWTVPTIDDTAVTAGVHTEGATLTDDGGKDAVFAEKTLGAFAFDTEWLRVSKELADDSIFAMETLIGNLLGKRLGRIANLQLTTGSGSSAPNGIVTASGAAAAAASTSAITADEIINLMYSVDREYRQAGSCGFMMHDTTEQAIRKLKDGDGNYLWQLGDFRTETPDRIQGKSYYVNNDMAELGDGVNSKVLLFGDFRQYLVRKVGNPLIGAIQDKDFWPGFGVAGYIRFDGELLDANAVKHLPLAAS